MARRSLRTSLGRNNGEKKCRCFVVDAAALGGGARQGGAHSLAAVVRLVAVRSLSVNASE